MSKAARSQGRSPRDPMNAKSLRLPRGSVFRREIDLEKYERMAEVCRMFVNGVHPADIADLLNDRWGHAFRRRITREDPYRILQAATREGLLQFRPPEHISYQEAIAQRCNWLEGKVRVVRTAVIDDVASHGAELVRELVQQRVRHNGERESVHVGLGGGVTMRRFARAFADLLCEPVGGLPARLVVHSLVAGFDPNDPTTVPSAFFSYFDKEPVMGVEPEFVGFNAPSVVRKGELPRLMRRDEIREARSRVRQLDIVVATGADCEEHSALRTRMASSKRTLRALERAGWVGDVMWRPLAAETRIEIETDIRAMTLIDLDRLVRLRAAGRQVVLLLGSCPECRQPRHRILRAVLAQREPLITHLVVDSRTAARFVRELGEKRTAARC